MDAVRLDDVVPGDVRVAVIKLDTQGTEHHVLAGAQALLTRDRPVILTEFCDAASTSAVRTRLLAALGRLGYASSSCLKSPRSRGSRPASWSSGSTNSPQEGGFTTLRLRPRPG